MTTEQTKNTGFNICESVFALAQHMSIRYTVHLKWSIGSLAYLLWFFAFHVKYSCLDIKKEEILI
jgi:hypothetical protein